MVKLTQEHIEKAKELNQQYKAGEITEQEAKNQFTDMYYQYDPNKLQNADVNVSKYWDDHTEKNYNNSEMWWWENQKYTGENTKNSYTAYDPNATTEWLDPNYQYWKNAQMANSEQANYIANRNDQIASALYNEWKTSIEDVANFLRTQRGFDNSTENERQNTIYSVWKRLGQIAQENWNKDTEISNWPTDQSNDQALQNMQDDLMKDTSGKLYGKVTADETEYGNAINTVADPYNVDRMMAESRIANVKKLQTMDSQSIAASIISGTTPYGEQAMRDLMQYNPQKYEEIQTAIKQLRGQMEINSITKGERTESYAENKTELTKNSNIYNAENLTDSWQSAAYLLSDVETTLSSNQVSNSAEQTMKQISSDMEKLKTRLKNLDKEANSVFKWDVPQYIVNAYKANRTAEIQDKLTELENQYNAAWDRQQAEIDNTWKQKEYELKLRELQLKEDSAAWDRYMDAQWLSTTSTSTWTRTERNNNPTAMTTDVAKTLWLVEWVDYVQWDPFSTSSWTLYTAKFLWDPIETTIKALDTAVANWTWAFYTQSWKQRWTHTAMSNEERSALSDEEKRQVVLNMLQREWGNINNMSYYTQNYTTEWTWDWYYNPNYADIYGKFLQWKFVAWKQLETAAQSLWLTVDELRSQANAWKNAQKDNSQVTSRLDAIERLLGQDIKRLGRQMSAWSFFDFFSEWWTDRDSAYDFVKDNITFDKLLELKRWWATFWALSDNELRAIGNAAVNLDRGMSREEFEKQLTWIYNELLRWIWETQTYTAKQIADKYKNSAWVSNDLQIFVTWNGTWNSQTPTYTAEDILGAN